MFGMGFGMDMGMGMGMGIGQDIGMMQGAMMMDNAMMMDDALMMDNAMMMGGGMGMGMGMGRMGGMRGMGGMGRQQIIINGNGGTTIIQEGIGMGRFGGRQQIIINNGGFGGRNNVLCLPGCTGPCCRPRVINCGPNCTRPCCRPPMYNQYTQQQPPLRQQQYYPSQQQRPHQKVIVEQQIIIKPQKKVFVEQQVIVRQKPQKEIIKQQFITKEIPRREIVKEQVIINNNRIQYPTINDSSSINIPNQKYGGQQVQQQKQSQKQYQQQILFSGNLFSERMGQWQSVNPTLTCMSFSNIPIKMITKIKVKAQSAMPNCRLIKITAQGRDHFFCAPSNQHCQYFVRIVWARMAFFNKYSDMYAEQCNISGNIFKKGEIMGKWQQRYVTINIGQGLCSYKNSNSKPSLIIPHTQQLWTRFEIIMGGSFMNVKLKHNGIKYQFGIACQEAVKWLKAFYSLLKYY